MRSALRPERTMCTRLRMFLSSGTLRRDRSATLAVSGTIRLELWRGMLTATLCTSPAWRLASRQTAGAPLSGCHTTKWNTSSRRGFCFPHLLAPKPPTTPASPCCVSLALLAQPVAPTAALMLLLLLRVAECQAAYMARDAGAGVTRCCWLPRTHARVAIYGVRHHHTPQCPLTPPMFSVLSCVDKKGLAYTEAQPASRTNTQMVCSGCFVGVVFLQNSFLNLDASCE